MSSEGAKQPVPIEWVLEADREIHVASIELGVTFYLAEPLHWAQSGAARALQHFVHEAPSELLRCYTTSRLDHWKPITRNSLHEVVEAFSVHWLGKIRHGFEFFVGDDAGSESCGFRYVEVDPARVTRSSLLELTLPAHSNPVLLLRLADLVCELGPVHAAIGGFALRYNTAHKASAFNAGHAFAKRYLGMDIQDRECMPWLVHDKVPGVSWFNYLGKSWLEASKLDAAALCSHSFDQAVTVTRSQAGLRIIAGAQPTLADLNHFEQPRAYEALAHELAPHFVATPPTLYGAFQREQDAAAWFARHLAPANWT